MRSIRISEKLDEILREEATRKRVSPSALVSMILTKYAEWDRYADRFGFVTITRDGFKSFIESIEDQKLAKTGEDLGFRNPKEMSLFWFKKLDAPTFLKFLSVYCNYGRIAEYDVEKNDSGYTITLHHDLGKKYSEFLSHFFDQAVRAIAGSTPRIEVRGNGLTINIS